MTFDVITNNAPKLYDYYGINSMSGQAVNVPMQQSFTGNPTLKRNPSSDSINLSANAKPPVEKNGISTGTKWAIGLGVIALASAGIAFATKGKKINISSAQEVKLNELIKNGQLDEKYVDIFKSTEHLSGDAFIKSVYKKIAGAMGYETHPPLKIISENSTSSFGHGEYVRIDRLAFKTKEELLDAIRHELEHCRQDDLIYRAFGKDVMFDALAQKNINKLKINEEYCISKMGKKYSNLSESEIEAFKKTTRKIYETPDSVEFFENLFKEKGKIPVGSAEYKEAEKCLQATREYVSPCFGVNKNETLTADLLDKLKVENPEKFALMKKTYQEYKRNALETGAIQAGKKIKDMYNLFKETIK